MNSQSIADSLDNAKASYAAASQSCANSLAFNECKIWSL